MIHDAFTAKKIAELLIQINAIKLEPKNPLLGPVGGNLQYIVTTASHCHIRPFAHTSASSSPSKLKPYMASPT